MGVDTSVLVSTFERPWHLRRALEALRMQRGFNGRWEIVVTDDGSCDSTSGVIEQFAQQIDVPVAWTTHRHDGYQLARCRNEGVAVCRGDYLIFLDGDCLVPSDFLAVHQRHRNRRTALVGGTIWLDEHLSRGMTLADVQRERFVAEAPRRALRQLRWRDLKSRVYSWFRHPEKPKLMGGNLGMFRADYELVNGYDQAFRGWGCEDDDLRRRLGQVGVQIHSSLRWTRTYHLWHPRGNTTPEQWKAGANVAYYLERGRPADCEHGLAQARAAHGKDWQAECWNWSNNIDREVEGVPAAA